MSELIIFGKNTIANSADVNTNFKTLDQRVTNTNRDMANLQTSLKSFVYSTLSNFTDVNTLDTSGEIALSDNTINMITPTASVTFTLPTISDETPKFHQILVQLNLTDVSYAPQLGVTRYFYKIKPSFARTGRYNIVYEYDNAEGYWYVGVIEKGAVS